MLNSETIHRAIDRGIVYLKTQQLDSGGFLSYAGSNPNNFLSAQCYKTIFSSTLILQNLASLKNIPELHGVKTALIQFLLRQKSPHSSWNYWDSESQESSNLPYPDDLDDSFCALTALQLTQPSLITGTVLAQATQLLTTLEKVEGGPYKTWLVDAQASEVWQDVDLGVNLNIGYFLHLNGVILPGLTAFFETALEARRITTPYYPLPLPILFFASRFLQSPKQKKLLVELLQNLKPQNSLEAALLLLSTANLKQAAGPTSSVLVEKLLTAQQTDGSWPAGAFYTGVNPDKTKKLFAGSAALTTSFVLQALHQAGELQESKSKNPNSETVKLKAKVLQKVTQRFSELSPDLQQRARQYFKQVKQNDLNGQITLLPWLFCQTVGERATAISKETLITLGAASVYGWMACTMYDDFLDAEAKVETLPLANVCLRELTGLFTHAFPNNAECVKLFHRILDQQEAANVWEVSHCRFNPASGWNKAKPPDFGDLRTLAHRSLGHSLGCGTILLELQYSAKSSMVKNLELFFHHYLIARQLNDDAHDWEVDLARGQITAVGAHLLSVPHSDRRRLFWTETIDWVCHTMQQQLTLAETALQNLTELQKPELLRTLLTSQANAIARVQTEREKARDFLKNY